MSNTLLTVPQVAEEFQVTAQTIRNWIDQGVLPAVRVGRAFRIRRADVDALLDRAQAESESLATQRDRGLRSRSGSQDPTDLLAKHRSGTPHRAPDPLPKPGL